LCDNAHQTPRRQTPDWEIWIKKRTDRHRFHFDTPRQDILLACRTPPKDSIWKVENALLHAKKV
jgi:hypothetical protein